MKFGCNAEETSEATQQILCCDSSAALGMIKHKGSTRKTRHRVESVLPTTMERATGSETCSSGDERNACGLVYKDTVDTKFDTSLETRIADQIQSLTDLNLVEKIERRRSAEMPL